MTSTAKKLQQQALKLPEPDRLALALALWGSMHGAEPDMDDGERQFAERKLAEHRGTPDDTIPWSESKRRMAKKSGQ